MQQTNKGVRFVKRPLEKPDVSVFAMQEEALNPIGQGQYLMRNIYLSMDPALVGRMRDEDNYADKVNLGETMHAYGIAQVIQSKNEAVKVGEIRLGRIDMQEYSILSDASASTVINLGLADANWYLSAVGITGATAYFALNEIGKPQVGETVLVSSGGSSVGSLAGQIAKQMGCVTVAIVSTDEKAKQVKQDFAYDQAISYRGKSIDQLSADIQKACPQGVDVYFDNTSGDISEAVLDQLNQNARIAVVGRLGISHLANSHDDVGRRDHNILLTKRVKKQGFVILDYQDRMKGALIRLARWVKEGQITGLEDRMQGIDAVPDAFFKMLDGKSTGKQIVQLAEINDMIDPAPRWLGRLMIAKYFPTRWLARRLTGGI